MSPTPRKLARSKPVSQAPEDLHLLLSVVLKRNQALLRQIGELKKTIAAHEKKQPAKRRRG
jgi:hypothetical protein